MNKKARWAFTVAAVALVLSSVLTEASTDGLSGALDCLGKSPITGLVARGNALALVP